MSRRSNQPATGKRDMERFRTIVEKELKDGFNVGHEVAEAFKTYRRKTRQTSPEKRDILVKHVTDWTGVSFGERDVGSDLKRLKENEGIAAERAWAIFYSMRFFSDPLGHEEVSEDLSFSEQFTEALERKLIRRTLEDGKKRERCFRDIDGNKRLTHPNRLKLKSDRASFEASGRLPSRYFQPRLDESYQIGRKEFLEVREVLLRACGPNSKKVISITGSGGYGKTAIAEEVVADAQVRMTFPGGIYWLQHGLRFGADEKRVESYISTQEAIGRMLLNQFADLDMRDRNFSTPQLLFDAMPEERFLIVADDVWVANQCAFIDYLPERASALISTRGESIAKAANRSFRIEELSNDQSYNLLTHGMGDLSNQQESSLRLLRDRFSGWPLLLKLANGHFRWLRDQGGSIEDAIAEYQSFFKRGNIAGWDVVDPIAEDTTAARRELARLCIETGLRAILKTKTEHFLFEALAIFPDDTDIPFDMIERLWKEIQRNDKPIDQVQASILWRRANDYNLFRQYNHRNRSLRLHDEMLTYLRGAISKQRSEELNGFFVQAISRLCGGQWHKLPTNESYPWRYLIEHMRRCGLHDDADELSLDLDWLSKSLLVQGSAGLQESLRADGKGPDVERVIQVLTLASSLLDSEPTSLFHELFGRLCHEPSSRLKDLANSAYSHENCWPHPRQSHLKPLGSELNRFEGHKASVNHAIFDRTEKYVVTASDDHSACRWNTDTGTLLNQFTGHQDAVLSVSICDTGDHIVTASTDRTARVWCVRSEKQIQCLEGHRASVTGAILDNKGKTAVTTSDDYTTRVWCASQGEELHSFDGKCTSLNANLFSRTSPKCATIFGDIAIVCSLTSMETVELVGHDDEVSSAALSDDGEYVLTSSWDGTARVWSALSGKELIRVESKISGSTLDLTCAVFAGANREILMSSILHANELWSLDENQSLSMDDGIVISKHGSSLFDENCEYALTVFNKRSVYLHDLRRKCFRTLVGRHHRPVKSVTFDQSGERILSASADGSAKLWSKGIAIQQPPEHRQQFRIWNATFHSSSKLAAAACSDRVLRIFDPTESRELLCVGRHQPSPHEAGMLDVDFSTCGNRVLTSSSDGLVLIRSLPDGIEQCKFPRHGASVSCARFDPKNERIVTASSDGRIKVFCVKSRGELAKRRSSSGPALQVVFNSDGSQVLSAHRSGVAKVRNSVDLEVLQTFRGHDAWVETATFNEAEDKVLTASGDGTVRLWSVSTGRELNRFVGHDAEVRSAAFDLSESFVISGSEDRTVRIWSVDTGHQIRKIRFDDPVKFVVVTSTSFFVGCGGDQLYWFDLL